jgi:hypothetical protein
MSRARLATVLAPATLLSLLLAIRPAGACSQGGGGNAVAYPPAGTTQVSTNTTIHLASIFDDGLSVLVDGTPLTGVTDVVVGNGLHDADPNGEPFRRLVLPMSSLPPGAHVEVRVRDNSNPDVIVTATSFDTATTSSTLPGTAATMGALRLWRVQYPKSEINSGNCVFTEFWSFVEIDWTPAAIPGTAPEGLVHVFTLTPKAGGAEQAFVLGGTATAIGHAPEQPHPFPLAPGWHPAIDPGVEYCVTARAYGDGDLGRPPLVSNSACATATEVVVPGAGTGGAAGSGGMATAGSGGMATAGGGGTVATGGAGAGGRGGGGAAGYTINDLGDDTGRPGNSSGGCAFGPGLRTQSPLLTVGLLGLVMAARRRRSAR